MAITSIDQFLPVNGKFSEQKQRKVTLDGVDFLHKSGYREKLVSENWMGEDSAKIMLGMFRDTAPDYGFCMISTIHPELKLIVVKHDTEKSIKKALKKELDQDSFVVGGDNPRKMEVGFVVVKASGRYHHTLSLSDLKKSRKNVDKKRVGPYSPSINQ